MRGTLDHLVGHVHVIRITPACAGNTVRQVDKRRQQRDHPRLCGEHRFLGLCTSSSLGSPPPVRGTPFELFVFELNFQITPACAGNTITPTSANCLFTDHPRLCGEHRIFQGFQVLVTGSPPPVRGTPQEPRFDPVKVRITPACAGNTCGQPMPGCITKDHPRLCGEHWLILCSIALTSGSPPPVRGTC